MNSENLKLAANIIDKSYIELAQDSLNSRNNQVKILLSQRSLPDQGWDDISIEYLLNQIALMDTNNFVKKAGVGERESRIFSPLVSKRNYHMGHGIGRSGDVKAIQPKAAGSSLIVKLTEYLAMDAIKLSGIHFCKSLILLPLATGMSLSLTLLSFKEKKPNAKYVIWPRIDQKTCLKCIFTANLEPIVIENIEEQNGVVTTDTDQLAQKIKEYGSENILCVLSTTSCFAPRIPDKIEEIAKICKEQNIFHVVNNAYGLQCSKICNFLNQGMKHGKIDAIVQSTDKNFMVPVGGSIIFSPTKEIIQNISSLYPGRASGGPILDLFITLLSMGKQGYLDLLKQRKQNLEYTKQKLLEIAQKYQFEPIFLPTNTISIGVFLPLLQPLLGNNSSKESIDSKVSSVSFLGSMLYKKRVMGSRLISGASEKKIGNKVFQNYGSHINGYSKLPYLTVAVAIGGTTQEIDWFMSRFTESLEEMYSLIKVDLKKQLLNDNQKKSEEHQMIQLEQDHEEKDKSEEQKKPE